MDFYSVSRIILNPHHHRHHQRMNIEHILHSAPMAILLFVSVFRVAFCYCLVSLDSLSDVVLVADHFIVY